MSGFSALLQHEKVSRFRDGNAWATNAVLIVLGCALLGLTRQFIVESDHFVIGFSGVSAWSAVIYLTAVFVVLTQPVNRVTLYIVAGFAIGFQSVVYFSRPFTSSDIYRYVWDGIVQHAGVNPYRYVPGDPALTALRQPHLAVFNNINRRDYAHTIYPPIAQMIYYFVTFFSRTVAGMKLAMIGFAGVAAAAIIWLLKAMGRRREEVLLYAWCPLVIWEIGLAGHVDAVMLAFIALALVFRCKGMPGWTGLFLGLAILTKFYPAVLLPALYMRRDWKMPAVIVALTAASYGLYASAGKLVLGFVGGYQAEEGMNTGARYFLLALAHRVPGLHEISVHVYMLFCGLVFCVLIVWVWLRATNEVVGSRADTDAPVFLKCAMAFAFAMMLMFSPHYPWYVLWLVPFFALVPNLPLVTYLIGIFYLLTTALADGTDLNTYMLNKHLYIAVAVAFVLQWVLSGWRLKKYFVVRARA